MSETSNHTMIVQSSSQHGGGAAPRRLMTRRPAPRTVDANGSKFAVGTAGSQQRGSLQAQRVPLGARNVSQQSKQAVNRMLHPSQNQPFGGGHFSGNGPMSPPNSQMLHTSPTFQPYAPQGYQHQVVHSVDQLITRQHTADFRMCQKRVVPVMPNMQQPSMKRQREMSQQQQQQHFARNQTYPNPSQPQFPWVGASNYHHPPAHNQPGFRQQQHQQRASTTRFVPAREVLSPQATEDKGILNSASGQLDKLDQKECHSDPVQNELNCSPDGYVVSRENDLQFLSEFFILEEGSAIERMLSTAIYS